MSSRYLDGRKPDLVCVGAQKAGTSWLNEVLADHPQIWTPPFKELHFFDHKFIDECRKWTPWHVRKSVRTVLERADQGGIVLDDDYRDYLERIRTKPMFNGTWYKAIFAPAPEDALCLDVTPEYSTLPDEGVAFATKFLKDAKFIYILRNPLDRAVSQLRMNVSRRKTPPASLDDWMEEAENPVLQQRGDYAAYVPRWQAHLPEAQVLFLPYGRIKSDPTGLLADIERFAGLSPHRYPKAARKIHVTPHVAVPDACIAYLRQVTDPQAAFLKEAFGPAFANMT